MKSPGEPSLCLCPSPPPWHEDAEVQGSRGHERERGQAEQQQQYAGSRGEGL